MPSLLRCPKCGADDPSMIEVTDRPGGGQTGFCNVCAHDWRVDGEPEARFHSIEELIKRTGVNRAELATLAEIGALNSFGYHRREALWQIERAIRPAGELFEGEMESGVVSEQHGGNDSRPPFSSCPLSPMTPIERVVADYEGTSLTLGPHPMAIKRGELALRGVLRAADLARFRHGRHVRVAGAVITRQRPGTAKGFVFLTLEDETGIANIIVRPDLFAEEKLVIIEAPFLLVEGLLQNQEGVTSVRADHLEDLGGTPVAVESHDFY